MRGRVGGVVLAAMCACHRGDVAPLRLDHVEPPTTDAGRAAAIRVSGSFPVDVHVDFVRGGLQADTDFALLLAAPLADVTYVDAGTLTATVPATMPIGSHTLTVVGPQGRSATLAAAFTVTDPPFCPDPSQDTDRDGTPDCDDACPTDPKKQTPGVCACGVYASDCDSGMCDGAGCLTGCNVLVNGGHQTGDLTGWTITQSCGDGWQVEHAYCDVDESPDHNDGFIATTSFNDTSSEWCSREQLVDLIAAGFTQAELETLPDIRVGEWVSSNCSPADPFRLTVEIRDASDALIDSWDTGVLGSTDRWTLNSHTFTGYAAPVRTVRFWDSGRDELYWSGFYGTAFDGAFVTVTGLTCP